MNNESKPPSDINLGVAVATVINERVVILRGKPGVEINRQTASSVLTGVEQLVPGEFGLIIDRKADYSVAPVETFDVLNNTPRLKAVAMVTYRPTTTSLAQLDQRLYKGQLKIFNALDAAEAWINAFMNP